MQCWCHRDLASPGQRQCPVMQRRPMQLKFSVSAIQASSGKATHNSSSYTVKWLNDSNGSVRTERAEVKIEMSYRDYA